MPMATSTAQLLLPSRTKGTLKIPKADKERAAMVRCYEVYIGDRVEIDTHDEGTVQGVICIINNKHAVEGGTGV